MGIFLNKKLFSAYEKYESININKGIFSKDSFGMGPEYDQNVAFYRRLIDDAFGSADKAKFREINRVLSYTNQLVMENNYTDPITYFTITDRIRTDLSNLGLNKAAQYGIDGLQLNKLSPHATSPELAMLMGQGNGVSIKPMGLLSEYRMGLLKRFIEQGKNMKNLQKRNGAGTMEETYTNYKKAGHCKPL